MELPEGYNDAIHTDVDIHLSFFDRIKVLLGWKFVLNSITYCENLPGKVFSKSEVKIYRIHKHAGFTINLKDSQMMVNYGYRCFIDNKALSGNVLMAGNPRTLAAGQKGRILPIGLLREGKMDENKELEMEYDIYPHPKMDEKDDLTHYMERCSELKSLLSEKEKEIEELKKVNNTQDEMLDIASTRINKAEARTKELEEGIKTKLSDIKGRREFTYIRRWDMEVMLGELLGIKTEDL